MFLTQQQLQILKTWIVANHPNSNDFEIRDALNATFSPQFLIYRTKVPFEEVMSNNFDWTRVDNLSVGKSRIWDWLREAREDRTFNAANVVVRAGINEVWKGTAADLAVRAVIYTHVTRPATVMEKLLATGSGTAPNANGDGPGIAAVEGDASLQNVVDAMNS